MRHNWEHLEAAWNEVLYFSTANLPFKLVPRVQVGTALGFALGMKTVTQGQQPDRRRTIIGGNDTKHQWDILETKSPKGEL